MLPTMIRVIPVLGFPGTAGGDGGLKTTELPEVDTFAFVVNRRQPALVFCDPVDATDAGCVMPLAARVAGVFSLRHRPQVFNPVVVSDSVDVVDKIWVGAMHEFPDDPMCDPDCFVGADADVPLRVEASCGLSGEDLVPRGIAGARIPEQLPRSWDVLKNFQQGGLGRQSIGAHIGAPCNMGTSVIDQMGEVKELVCH